MYRHHLTQHTIRRNKSFKQLFVDGQHFQIQIGEAIYTVQCKNNYSIYSADTLIMRFEYSVFSGFQLLYYSYGRIYDNIVLQHILKNFMR